jgi:assimilatory nitrate reductase catalytic subunit
VDTNQRFLRGTFSFSGRGRADPAPLGGELRHVVSGGVVARLVYFRGRNDSGELIYVVLVRDGGAMRHFPITAHGEVYIPLRVVEDLSGGSVIELRIAAPEGLTGTVDIDLGLLEVSAVPG